MVLSLGCRQIILGMPWLKKWNPAINWKRNTMTLPENPLATETTSVPQWYLVCWLGIDANTKINKHLRKRELWKENKSINKITISTQMAQQNTPSETPVPDWCTDFSDVFSEQTHAKLPPHRHYNHTIDLQPTFTPCIAKIYPLNPAELQTCKEFVDEYLKMGQIVPSKSPQASLFFFIPKKDSSLHPCQDYWYLNSHTIQNVYPLPLIPKLINDMKDTTLFMKFDIRWGYNNICICEEDQWKAAFITPLGLFEPTVMFFVLQFSSWVVLFSSSLSFMPRLLSQGPFPMLTIIIFLSWDPSHSLYVPSNLYAVPYTTTGQRTLFAYLFLVMDDYSFSRFSHICCMLLLLILLSMAFHDLPLLLSRTFYLVPSCSFTYSADLLLSI